MSLRTFLCAILSLFLASTTIGAEAEKTKGLVKPTVEGIELIGFVKQTGKYFYIETKDRIYEVKRETFLKNNKLDQHHKYRQATYRVPAAALTKVEMKAFDPAKGAQR